MFSLIKQNKKITRVMYQNIKNTYSEEFKAYIYKPNLKTRRNNAYFWNLSASILTC